MEVSYFCNNTSWINTLIKLIHRDKTKKRAHDSQRVRAKENLKLKNISHNSGGGGVSIRCQIRLLKLEFRTSDVSPGITEDKECKIVQFISSGEGLF